MKWLWTQWLRLKAFERRNRYRRTEPGRFMSEAAKDAFIRNSQGGG